MFFCKTLDFPLPEKEELVSKFQAIAQKDFLELDKESKLYKELVSPVTEVVFDELENKNEAELKELLFQLALLGWCCDPNVSKGILTIGSIGLEIEKFEKHEKAFEFLKLAENYQCQFGNEVKNALILAAYKGIEAKLSSYVI